MFEYTGIFDCAENWIFVLKYYGDLSYDHRGKDASVVAQLELQKKGILKENYISLKTYTMKNHLTERDVDKFYLILRFTQFFKVKILKNFFF